MPKAHPHPDLGNLRMDEGQDTSDVCAWRKVRMNGRVRARRKIGGALSKVQRVAEEGKTIRRSASFAPSFPHTADRGYFYRPGTHHAEKEQIHL